MITVNNKNIKFSYDDAVNIANKVAIEKFNYSSNKQEDAEIILNEIVRVASQIAASVIWEYHENIIKNLIKT